MSRHFYARDDWRHTRDVVLTNDPFCAECRKAGKLVSATQVDHITPISKGGDPFDMDNLQPLCHSCHSRKTATQDMGRRVKGAGVDGVPLDPKHHWNR